MASYSVELAVELLDVLNRSPSIQSGIDPRNGRVQQLFEARAAAMPQAPAVLADGRLTTYGELDAQANGLANRLRAAGISNEVPVAICVGRSAAAITAILAVLKAGGAYLPLDPAYPADRLVYMLASARASVVITDATAQPTWPDGVTVLHVDDVTEGPEDAAVSTGRTDLHEDRADGLAYVIYTSGSTGRPKGVAMPHRPLLNLLAWQARTCPLPPGARVLQFAPLSFDVSFQEIFSTLGEGGTLVMISEEVRRDPAALLRLLTEERIARVYLPPVMLYQLAEQAPNSAAMPGHLREVVTAGEALRITPAVATFFSRLAPAGGCTLHNHYGPTETHVVTAGTLEGDPAAWPALPSIGQPIDGVTVRLDNEEGHPVPEGEPGNLLLGGECLARGYVHDPELTWKKFVERDGGRWYATGDLAQVGPDGNLQFLGRADDQVKIRGFRVELGEIEAVLARHSELRATAVGAVRREDHLDQELVAYVVPRDPLSAPAAAELRRWLRGQLPDYLVPTHFATLDRLPLTPSGKVDRRALAAVPAERAVNTTGPLDPPRTALEKTIAKVWEEALGLTGLGVRDHFLELGGNSLLAVRVHSRLCQLLAREFPVAVIFQHATIAALASHLETPAGAPGGASAVQERARRQQQAAAAARARQAAAAPAGAVGIS